MAWTAPTTWTTGQIVMASGTDSLNEQIRDNFLALDQHAHTGAAGDGSSTLTGISISNVSGYQFADQSADPNVTGTLQRNGANLLYYNGTSAINLTASDQAAGTPSLRTLGTSGTVAAAGDHTHTIGGTTYANFTAIGITSPQWNSGATNLQTVDTETQPTTTTPPNETVHMNYNRILAYSTSTGGYVTEYFDLMLYLDGVLVSSTSGYSTALQTYIGYGAQFNAAYGAINNSSVTFEFKAQPDVAIQPIQNNGVTIRCLKSLNIMHITT